MQGAAITSNLFPTLGVQPILGRHFREDDDRPGAEPVVMLSHEVWQRRYHGDPAVVGRSIRINGKPHTVIGVMPPRFSFPETQKVWIPLGPDAATDKRDSRYLFTVGRLKPGVDLARARAELASIASALSAQYPSTNDGWSAMVRPIADKILPNERAPRAGDNDGRGHARAAGGVRQCCEPDASAIVGPSARILRPRRARRRTRATGQAVAHRVCRARPRRGAARTGDCLCWSVAARSGRASRPGAVLPALGNQRPRHRLHHHRVGADRPGLRPGAGAAGRTPRPAGDAARRRSRIGTEQAQRAVAQCARHDRSGSGADPCSWAPRSSSAAS